jgi:indolepyruvate ferredoxin oxidoreductase alpha subunit
MLDPADSQEAYDFTREAYEISERFDVPVFIRSTVRVSHTQTPVQTSPAADFTHKTYESKPQKWVMMPANAKGRRVDLLARNDALKAWAYDTPLNKVERGEGGSKIGVICAGAVYQHVKAALPDADVLKLGVTFPISEAAVREFADSVERLFVIEEASTYLRDAIRACGVHVSEPPFGLTKAGELSPNLIKAAFGRDLSAHADVPSDVPPRPPALCAGCPHRLVFKELSRKKAIVTGDIGCYTLGALPPLSCIDTCVDMGASVSMAHGMELAFAQSESTTRPVVAVIGDSTFAHSGLSSLISTFYNGGTGVVCVLDNRTTAMTGRQGNPFNGTTLQNRPSHELDIESVVRAIGVTDVRTVNPNVMQDVREAIGDAVANKDELSVIVFKSPCILLERNYSTPYSVASCTGCGVCVTLGCPAIGKDAETGLAYIDATACIGCGQCAQYCRFNAITNN